MKIYVLVGPIASAKSTYCKNAAKTGILCVNDDSIVNMLHADVYTLYNKDLKILYKSIENHVISAALGMKRSVIVDRGLNISIQGRKRWIALAKSFDITIEAIIFQNEGPEIHAERRAKCDDRGRTLEYWQMVAKEHQERWNDPTLEEGFNVIHRISFEEISKGKVII